MRLGKVWMFVWHKAAMIHGKHRSSVPKAKAELGELGALGRKCCCSLSFGNSKASLDFSRDFQMVVWFEHLWLLSTFNNFLVAFLLILYGALCFRTAFFFLYGNFSNLCQIELSGTGEMQCYKTDHVILEFWSEGEVIEEHIPTLE